MEDKEKAETPKRSGFFKKLAKTIMWFVIGIVLLITLLLGGVVWILTPERLTPIVEQYANEFLDAQVEIGRVELTFWKTFPQLKVDVDSVTIVSDNFKELDDSHRVLLPANADTLLSLTHFHGGVGVTALMAGKIEVYEVELREPMINLVQLDDSLSNFDIIPPSAPDTTTSSVSSLPEIAIDRFIIADALPITYKSIADNMNVGIVLGATYIDGNAAPQYEVALNGDAKALLPPTIVENDLPIGFNGEILWNPEMPSVVTVKDFAIDIAELHSVLNTSVDVTDDIIITSLDYRIKELAIADAMKHIPAEYNMPMLQRIKTDIKVNAGVTLLEPYNLSDSVLPKVTAMLEIPKGNLQFGNHHKPLAIAALVDADINGQNLNASVVNVKKFTVNGVSIDVAIDGTFRSLLKDPNVNANFKGSLYLDNLPPIVLNQIPGEIRGKLTANTSVKLRQSYLSKNGFHKVKVSGEAKLQDFTYVDSVTDFYTRETTFKFGTSNSFVRGERSIDSMLTASIKIDTARVNYSGTKLIVSNMRAGVGCKNVASSTDSTQINPMRATISAHRVVFQASDSSRMRMRDTRCIASLHRFQHDAKIPELSLVIDSKNLSYGDKLNRMSLRDGNVKIKAHIKKRKKMSPRMQARYDSIAKLYPDIASDSVFKLMRASMRRGSRNRVEEISDKEVMDFALDNSTRELLRRWNVQGTITAKRGRMFTPYFPLRNSLKDVNIDFNTDSLTLKNVGYTVGKSDFTINGSVKNISRALTSRRGSPLYIDFSVRSDTVDVNEIAEAVFAGAAFSEKELGNLSLENVEDEDSMQMVIDQLQDTSQMAALLLPTNIDATIRLRAHNIIYADMLMKRMRGIIMMRDGALNMHKLTASADIGTIGLSALYTAPSKKDLKFGFGLEVKDLDLNKVINMVPAIDTIMPMLKSFEGIIDADIAATTDIDTAMNFVLPTLSAAIKLHGDSLVLLDADTFKFLSKWLMFKNKKRNMIDNMTVEMLVENSVLELFPFMFDIDRYRLGVMGSNDMALNYNYHVSVLKSPLPFKFGLNVSGNIDDMKIRVGKAKFKDKMVSERVAIVDTTRINLLNQIENVFRRGVDVAKLGKLEVDRSKITSSEAIDAKSDTISHADSLMLIKEGYLPAPVEVPSELNSDKKK